MSERSEQEINEVDAEKEEIDEDDNLFKKYIIRCSGLVKEYEIGDYIVRAVDNVDLAIERGEFLVIKGPSGAGKTTLISLIAGLDAPTEGDVYIEWVRVSDLQEETMSTFRVLNLGYVFQNYNLISSLTAGENIKFPMQLAGITPEKQEERVKELLKKIGLEDREEHLPYQLSAGEQQRVGIARALANDPPIIIADEPTANLDQKSSEIISNLFKELNKSGKTLIIVSHDEKLLNQAHRVVTFEDAKIVNEDIIREIESNEHQRVESVKFTEKLKEKIRNELDSDLSG
ncbi:MAG: ABC transporter ATP-binding protein [Promethearchaeota archaeon]